jgi:hypothetical protein
MARLIQAMREYGPRLELGPLAETESIVEWATARNRLLSSGAVKVALIEIAEAVLHFNGEGIPVRLEGLGIFTPTIDRNGTIKHNYRADAKLKQRSNAEGAYTGRITNGERIGLSNAGYKELWDADHPDDPLEIQVGGPDEAC